MKKRNEPSTADVRRSERDAREVERLSQREKDRGKSANKATRLRMLRVERDSLIKEAAIRQGAIKAAAHKLKPGLRSAGAASSPSSRGMASAKT
jgi:hypothetical protein